MLRSSAREGLWSSAREGWVDGSAISPLLSELWFLAGAFPSRGVSCGVPETKVFGVWSLYFSPLSLFSLVFLFSDLCIKVGQVGSQTVVSDWFGMSWALTFVGCPCYF
ncbi:unnamed protein product [Arabis nemorensis]|uniref:Uncharacterized protein n=1 Tax=Arabis nemorensis TaxID=586526 RepID=A0A565BIJ5_9BRAS|nr:unnamed protein product [Arabis nemorensis]